MICKQCEKNLDGEEYKMVADWPFCEDCFKELMEKAAEKKTFSTEEKPPPAGRIAAETQIRCQSCEKPVDRGSAKKLGLFSFCEDCYSNLIARPKPLPEEEAEEESEEELDPAARSIGLRFHIHTQAEKDIPCDHCKRMITEKGSKKFYDKSLCPECYYALPEEKRAEAEAVAKQEADETVVSEKGAGEATAESEIPGNRCEACGRKSAPELLETVEGFFICRPCMKSDPDTALEIARKRHRQYLQSAKNKLSE